MSRTVLFCAAMLLATPVRSEDAPTAPRAAHRAVMKAQYEARQPARPMRSEEAQRIYDAYLRGIGQSRNSRSPDNGSEETTPQSWQGP